ncbi:hypothetical protein ILYODFUR_037584 [Ilyodon furcidens]|uniref:Uncharacterized protein n=1 Tax=Ilyodon furcidens TaxID=33524 RepID=A0ABV0SSF1_9TELE
MMSASDIVQGQRQINPRRFQVSVTFLVGAISISSFMPRSHILRCDHTHILSCIKKLLITFDPQSLKSILSDFQVSKSKAVGGVRSDMRARKGKSGVKMAISIQDGRLSFGFG